MGDAMIVALVGGPCAGSQHACVPWVGELAIPIVSSDAMNLWHGCDLGHYPLRLLTYPPMLVAVYAKTDRRSAAGLREFAYVRTESRRTGT